MSQPEAATPYVDPVATGSYCTECSITRNLGISRLIVNLLKRDVNIKTRITIPDSYLRDTTTRVLVRTHTYISSFSSFRDHKLREPSLVFNQSGIRVARSGNGPDGKASCVWFIFTVLYSCAQVASRRLTELCSRDM